MGLAEHWDLISTLTVWQLQKLTVISYPYCIIIYKLFLKKGNHFIQINKWSMKNVAPPGFKHQINCWADVLPAHVT